MINIAKTSLAVAVSLVLMSGCSSENSGNTSAEGKSSTGSTEKSSSSGAPSIKKSNLVLDLNKEIDKKRIDLYLQNDESLHHHKEDTSKFFYPEKYKEIENIKDVVDKEDALNKVFEDVKKLREESLEGATIVYKSKNSFEYKDGKIEILFVRVQNSEVMYLKIEPSSKEDLKKLANDKEGYIELRGTLYFIKPKGMSIRFMPRLTDTHIEVFDKDNNKINTAKISYQLINRTADNNQDTPQEIVQ